MRERSDALIFSARDTPPFRPNATAAGSLPRSSGVGSRSSTAPVAISTMRFAHWFRSRGRLGRFSAMIGDTIKTEITGRAVHPDEEPERWVWLSGLAPFSFAGRPTLNYKLDPGSRQNVSLRDFNAMPGFGHFLPGFGQVIMDG